MLPLSRKDKTMAFRLAYRSRLIHAAALSRTTHLNNSLSVCTIMQAAFPEAWKISWQLEDDEEISLSYLA